MFDLFISHSARDSHVALAAKHHLESFSIRCWKAPEDIAPGAIWEEAITRAITSSRGMLLIWSQHSQGSAQVSRELSLAAKLSKIIIPFRTENIEPAGSFAYYLSNTHWLDALSDDIEDDLKKLGILISDLLPSQIEEDEDNADSAIASHLVQSMSANKLRDLEETTNTVNVNPTSQRSQIRLKGEELLEKISSLGEEGISVKAEECGYAIHDDRGVARLDYAAFSIAVQDAVKKRQKHESAITTPSTTSVLEVEAAIIELAISVLTLCSDLHIELRERSLLKSGNMIIDSIRTQMELVNPRSKTIIGKAFAAYKLDVGRNEGSALMVFFPQMYAWVGKDSFQVYGLGSYSTSVEIGSPRTILTFSDDGRKSGNGAKTDRYSIYDVPLAISCELAEVMGSISKTDASSHLKQQWIQPVGCYVDAQPWHPYYHEAIEERHINLLMLLGSKSEYHYFRHGDTIVDASELLGACLISVIPFREKFLMEFRRSGCSPSEDGFEVALAKHQDSLDLLPLADSVKKMSRALKDVSPTSSLLAVLDSFADRFLEKYD